MIFSKKYPIAVDIKTRGINALQFKQTKGKLSIRSLLHLELDDELKDFKGSASFLTALKTLKKHSKFKGKRVVLHIPADKVLSFPIEFKVKDNESIDHAIIREAEKNLPFGLEEAVIDYPSITPEGKDKLRKAIIVAIRRDDILDLLAVFKKAGLMVEAVDFQPVSFIRLHDHLFGVMDKPGIICHIGYRESSVQIMTRDHILALNKFPWGVDQVKDKLNINLEFESEKGIALNLLRTHGISRLTQDRDVPGMDRKTETKIGRIITRIITPSIEELVFEFHKIIGYARSKEQIHNIENISFYGLTSMIKGLDQYIEKRMNISCRIVNPLDKIGLPKNSAQLAPDEINDFAPALGLGMREIPWL